MLRGTVNSDSTVQLMVCSVSMQVTFAYFLQGCLHVSVTVCE